MEKVFQRFYDAKRAELRAQGSALASNKSVATEKPDNISVTAGKPGNTSVVTEQPRDTTDVTEKLGDISGTAESPANVSQSESPPLFVTQISNSCATPGSSHDEFPSPSKSQNPELNVEITGSPSDTSASMNQNPNDNAVPKRTLVNEDEHGESSSDDIPLKILSKRRRLNTDGNPDHEKRVAGTNNAATTIKDVIPSPFANRPIVVSRDRKPSATAGLSTTEPRPFSTKDKVAHQRHVQWLKLIVETIHDHNVSRNELRSRLHELEHYPVTGLAIYDSGILETKRGLPSVYLSKDDSRFSSDIKNIAKRLARRWHKHDFDPDIYRGIITMGSWRLNPGYQYRVRADVFDDEHCPNGTWWPSMLCAVRDGAHGNFQRGIYGHAGKGAYSILLSTSQYSSEDVDQGETLWYCGTRAAPSSPNMTSDTALLFMNMENGFPVRVLRHSSLPHSNQYRPESGVRADGLYRVEKYPEILSATHLHYRFKLQRLPKQGPICYEHAYKRPTACDRRAFARFSAQIKHREE